MSALALLLAVSPASSEWKPEYDKWVNMLASMYQVDFDLFAWDQAHASDMIMSQLVVYEFGNIGASMKEGLPYRPWAADLVKVRRAEQRLHDRRCGACGERPRGGPL
jgi:hypothetical protein